MVTGWVASDSTEPRFSASVQSSSEFINAFAGLDPAVEFEPHHGAEAVGLS